MTETLYSNSIGPVDVAVIAFEGNKFTGEVAPALVELVEKGIVRILDLSFITKDAEGNVAAIEATDFELDEAFHNLTGSQFDLLSAADLDSIADDLDNSTSALILVWENVWAARFATASRNAGGTLAFFDRVPHEVVALAIEALSEG